MAYKDRNRQDQYRSYSNDWNEDDRNRQRSNYEDEPNYTNSENRGYGQGSRSYGSQGNSSGWESRYERQQPRNENYGGSYGGGNSSGRSGRQWESDYNEGTSGRGHTSGYSDFGGSYGSQGSSRNLYDRGNEGMDRSDYENRGNRLGAGNYGRYGDRGRYDQNQQHGGSSHGGSYGGSTYRDRGYGTNTPEDRSWWDRTSDEISSWFGDEGAERRRDRDRNHRGKGPKNYSRSDDRIKEDINDRLSDDPYIDASDIDVTVSSGEVTLSGTVEERSTKRRAEDVAEDVSGVKHVENRLRVGNTSSHSGSNSPSGTSGSMSSSPVSGSERSRNKENSYATSK